MGARTDNTGNTNTQTEIDPLLPKADVHHKEIIWKQYLAAFLGKFTGVFSLISIKENNETLSEIQKLKEKKLKIILCA